MKKLSHTPVNFKLEATEEIKVFMVELKAVGKDFSLSIDGITFEDLPELIEEDTTADGILDGKVELNGM